VATVRFTVRSCTVSHERGLALISLCACECVRGLLYGDELHTFSVYSCPCIRGGTDRHTADFTLLRAYTAPDGSAAPYSPDNVPYSPRSALQVSDKGAESGDFVFLLGFPGRTMRCVPWGCCLCLFWCRSVGPRHVPLVMRLVQGSCCG
jgi:hypothetical protein